MVDFHIIGQGLAGSVLALQLLERGYSLHLSDDPSRSSSSRAAAGLFNPIVFKKLSKSWMADQLFPLAEQFYAQQEKKLNGAFWHPMEMLRVIGSEQEKKDWEKIRKDPAFRDYIASDQSPESAQRFDRGFGSEWVKHCGYLDTVLFLEKTRALLCEKKFYSDQTIDYSIIHKQDDHWQIGNIRSKHVVFCEGWKAMENPYFNWLPFYPVKGDVLTFQSEEVGVKHLLNGGCFVLPVGESRYRIGSTFYWDDINDLPTEKGKKEILNKAKQLLNIDVYPDEHLAGVRPSTGDRRPFAGEHPDYKGLFILNGFGTKGVILAPWMAEHLIRFIAEKKELHPEVNITRHLKRYKNKNAK